MSCEKHKKSIEKYDGTLTDLVEDIGNLHYESLEGFFNKLSQKLLHDSYVDNQNGRVKLARELRSAAANVGFAALSIGRAWNLSKRFMEEPVKTNVEDKEADWDSLIWKFRTGGMSFNDADDLIEELKKEFTLIKK